MTVQKLIAELQKLPGDAEVIVEDEEARLFSIEGTYLMDDTDARVICHQLDECVHDPFDCSNGDHSDCCPRTNKSL